MVLFILTGAQSTRCAEDLHSASLALAPHLHGADRDNLLHVSMGDIIKVVDRLQPVLQSETVSSPATGQLRELGSMLFQYVAAQQVATDNMKAAELELAAEAASSDTDSLEHITSLRLQLQGAQAQAEEAEAAQVALLHDVDMLTHRVQGTLQPQPDHLQGQLRSSASISLAQAIAACSGHVAALSNDASEARSQATQAMEESKQLHSALVGLQAARDAMSGELSDAQAARDAMSGELSDAQAARDTAVRECDDLHKKVAMLQAGASAATASQSELAGEVQRFLSESAEREEALTKLAGELSDAQAARDTALQIVSELRSSADISQMLDMDSSVDTSPGRSMATAGGTTAAAGASPASVAHSRLALTHEAAALRAREGQLVVREAELDALQQRLAESHSNSEQLQAQLDSREQELRSKAAVLSAAQDRLDATESRVAEQLQALQAAATEDTESATQAQLHKSGGVTTSSDTEDMHRQLVEARFKAQQCRRRAQVAEAQLQAITQAQQKSPQQHQHTQLASAGGVDLDQELAELQASAERSAATRTRSEAAGLRAEVRVLSDQLQESSQRERSSAREAVALRRRVAAEAERAGRAIAEAQATARQLSVLEARQLQAQAAAASAQARAQCAEATNTSLEEQMAAAVACKTSQQASVQSLTRELAAARAGMDTARQSAADTRASLAAADEERMSLAQEVGSLRAALDAAQRQVSSVTERLRVVTAAARALASGKHTAAPGMGAGSVSVALTPTRQSSRSRFDAGSAEGDGLSLFMSPTLALAMRSPEDSTDAGGMFGDDVPLMAQVSSSTAEVVQSSQRAAALEAQLEAAGERERRVRAELQSLAGRLLHRRRETLVLETRVKELSASEGHLRRALQAAEEECRRCAGLASDAAGQLQRSKADAGAAKAEAADAVAAARSAAREADARVAEADTLQARLRAAQKSHSELQDALEASQSAEGSASSKAALLQEQVQGLEADVLRLTRAVARASREHATILDGSGAAGGTRLSALSSTGASESAAHRQALDMVVAEEASHSASFHRLAAGVCALLRALQHPVDSDRMYDSAALLAACNVAHASALQSQIQHRDAAAAVKEAKRDVQRFQQQAEEQRSVLQDALLAALPEGVSVPDSASGTAGLLALVNAMRRAVFEAGKATQDAQGSADRQAGTAADLQRALQQARDEAAAAAARIDDLDTQLAQSSAASEDLKRQLHDSRAAVTELQGVVGLAVQQRNDESARSVQAAQEMQAALSTDDAKEAIMQWASEQGLQLAYVRDALTSAAQALAASQQHRDPPAPHSTSSSANTSIVVQAPKDTADELHAYKQLAAQRGEALASQAQEMQQLLDTVHALSGAQHGGVTPAAHGASDALKETREGTKSVLASVASLFSVWKDMLSVVHELAPGGASSSGSAWGQLLATSNIITDTLSYITETAQAANQSAARACSHSSPTLHAGNGQSHGRVAATADALKRMSEHIGALQGRLSETRARLMEAADSVHSNRVAAAAAAQRRDAALGDACSALEEAAAARQEASAANERSEMLEQHVQMQLNAVAQAVDASRSVLDSAKAQLPGLLADAMRRHAMQRSSADACLARASAARIAALEEGQQRLVDSKVAALAPAAAAESLQQALVAAQDAVRSHAQDAHRLQKKVRVLHANIAQAEAQASQREEHWQGVVQRLRLETQAAQAKAAAWGSRQAAPQESAPVDSSADETHSTLHLGDVDVSVHSLVSDGCKAPQGNDGVSSVGTGSSQQHYHNFEVTSVPQASDPARHTHSARDASRQGRYATPEKRPPSVASGSTRAFSAAFGGAPATNGRHMAQRQSPVVASPTKHAMDGYTRRLAELARRATGGESTSRAAAQRSTSPLQHTSSQLQSPSALPARRRSKSRSAAQSASSSGGTQVRRRRGSGASSHRHGAKSGTDAAQHSAPAMTMPVDLSAISTEQLRAMAAVHSRTSTAPGAASLRQSVLTELRTRTPSKVPKKAARSRAHLRTPHKATRGSPQRMQVVSPAGANFNDSGLSAVSAVQRR